MTFPISASLLVRSMTEAAAADPAQAVAFQGAPGSNGHLAAMQAFPDALPLPCFSFEDAFDAVRDRRAAHAVLPIENALHGRVADIHFLLPESELFIVGELYVSIAHCLIGQGPVEAVTRAFSHPQALGQCRRWLRLHEIEPVAAANTATAVAELAARGAPIGEAAIAPRLAAETYGLPVLAEHIADGEENHTRFIVLAREALPEPAHDVACKTSLLFAVRNVPAALFKALGGFATNGVNLTRIESYQPTGSFQPSEFHIDVEGRPSSEAMAGALEELRFYSQHIRVLGTYPMQPKPEPNAAAEKPSRQEQAT